MKPELYTRVALTRNVPEEKLKRGDLAWMIEYLEHPEDGEASAIIEIFNALGESLRIATVPISAIAPFGLTKCWLCVNWQSQVRFGCCSF
jgi:hypothetical protein